MYIVIILHSETRSRTVFFVIIYNRFVDSSKCGPRDFDPFSQEIVPARLTRRLDRLNCRKLTTPRISGVTTSEAPEANILGAPHSHKKCQSYSYLSHLETQTTELTEAKESAHCHVRFTSHSDSGIT